MSLEKPPIKLIAIDLDGTVVKHDLSISEAVIAGLQRAQSDFGCKVVIATGRMFPSTLKFAARVGITNPVITYQGAMIRDISSPKPKVSDYPYVYHQGLDKETAYELIDWIQQEGCHANVYVDDQLYTNQFNEKSWYYQSITGVVPIHQPDLKMAFDASTPDPSKMMIIEEDSDRILDSFKARFGARINICVSRKDFCEIVHPQVSKWTAISHLLTQWGLSPENVLAIGDQDNDIPMIVGAGTGVAMGNAPGHIQGLADWVAPSIAEDGVLAALEEWVFRAQ
jgi:Cof subfamily protein (haloacid dehalogenase superfamily)